jgi:ABC-type sugar transport system ATPase subunit
MYNISKTFYGVQVLKNVNFNLKSGEIHALVGENGAGKSTLIKILGGIYNMDKGGRICICGQDVNIGNVEDAQSLGIAVMYQEISLVQAMTVADNLFMGKELLQKNKVFLDDKETIKRSQAIIDDFELEIDVQEKVGRLSIAKQQMVEICKALLVNAKVIVMDEPTSLLTMNEIEQLFIQITKLKKNGVSIIYISHHMDEIFKICEKATVLRDGQLIGTELTSNLNNNKIIEMMVGRPLSDVFVQKTRNVKNDEIMRLESVTNSKIHNINFTLKKGEILGFAGLIGAGRTEMARAIIGVDKIDKGSVYINGKKTDINDPYDAIRLGIGYVPEDRKSEGLFLAQSIKYNSSISILEKFIRFIKVNKRFENNIVEQYKKQLSIKMVSPEQKVQFLSGGNQQKIVLSKWLATNPDILILDEPTRGIDIAAKADIYKLIVEFAKAGKAILLISSELEEIINLSDRIIVMHEGEIAGEIENGTVTDTRQNEIMYFAPGGK